ncbi:MAG: DUF4376 domain-containing protein [Pseudomonas sp.]
MYWTSSGNGTLYCLGWTSYEHAVRNDGRGYRAVSRRSDVGSDEYFSESPIQVLDDPRDVFKQSRAEPVNGIKVTTSAGNTYDDDEVSQGRMARAILGLQAAGAAATVTWVLADNSIVQVTVAELSEALALAGAEQARLWTESMPR